MMFYPLHQYPPMPILPLDKAPYSDGRVGRPVDLPDVQRQSLAHEWDAMLPMPFLARAIHQGVAWLVSLVGHKQAGHVTTPPNQGLNPADHVCIPGVDC